MVIDGEDIMSHSEFNLVLGVAIIVVTVIVVISAAKRMYTAHIIVGCS